MLIRVMGRHRAAIRNPREMTLQYLAFMDAFGQATGLTLAMPALLAIGTALAGLVGGLLIVGQLGNEQLSSTVAIGPWASLIFMVAGAGAGFIAGQPLALTRMHKAAYTDCHPCAFDGDGAMIQRGAVKLFRGCFANSPDYFHGGSTTSGVLQGYIRSIARDGVTPRTSTIPMLWTHYGPISDADLVLALSTADERELDSLEDGPQGFQGAAPSDARAMKSRLVDSGRMEREIRKPRAKQFQEFAFWLFMAIAVAACVIQGITGYTVNLDPQAVQDLIP